MEAERCPGQLPCYVPAPIFLPSLSTLRASSRFGTRYPARDSVEVLIVQMLRTFGPDTELLTPRLLAS